MNGSSLKSTLGRPATLTGLTVTGWRRVFNAPFDGYAYLNLRPAPESLIEAASFELDPDELRQFDEREAGSELIELLPGYFAFVWPAGLCRELPVLESYIAVCRQGAGELGIDLTLGTDWPPDIVDDSADPLYP